MNNKDAIKEIRKAAKSYGLTFKPSSTKLNGELLWRLEDRKTGRLIISDYKLWTAYEDVQSGYIGTYDPTSIYFKGLNQE